MVLDKKSTRRRSAIYGERRAISLRLPIELHRKMMEYLECKMSANQYIQRLIEHDLAESTLLSHAKVGAATQQHSLKDLLVPHPVESLTLSTEDREWSDRLDAHLARIDAFSAFPGESAYMMCSSCGCAEVVPDTKDWLYRWEEYEILIPAVRGFFCPSCGDVMTFGDDERRLERLMCEFRLGIMERLRQLRK